MKTTAFLFTALLLFFTTTACEKEETDQNQSEEIIGSWKLTRITGGITGMGYSANFTDIEFKQNGIYSIHNNQALKGEGIYSLSQDSNELTLKLVPNDSVKITFEEHTKTVKLDKEKLILSDPCCDLFEYEFNNDSN